MLSIEKSQFKKEIEEFLAKGRKVTELPSQETPKRITAQTRDATEEDEDENT